MEVTKGEPPGAFAGTNDTNVGRTVGRYLVLERLGAGGMGVVYAAWDQTLDRKVALKLIHPERLGSSKKRKRAIQRMIKEARSLARLDHPNVVRYIGAVVAPPTYCVVLEYCDGRDLRRELERPTPPGLFLRVVRSPRPKPSKVYRSLPIPTYSYHVLPRPTTSYHVLSYLAGTRHRCGDDLPAQQGHHAP